MPDPSQLSTPDDQQQPQGAGPGGGAISPQDAQPDQNVAAVEMMRSLVSMNRRLGMRFPAVIAETREINDAITRMQQKLVQSRPTPEPQAPPV